MGSRDSRQDSPNSPTVAPLFSNSLKAWLATKVALPHPAIATLQEIHEVIQKESQSIVEHFTNHAEDLALIDYRSPLCFESITDYFHSMTRGVYKRHGTQISRFKEGLQTTAGQLNEVITLSTQRLAKNADSIFKDGRAKKVMVYSYSKALSLTLKRLSKSLEDGFEVFVCASGGLQEG